MILMSGIDVDSAFLPDNISPLIQSSFTICYLLLFIDVLVFYSNSYQKSDPPPKKNKKQKQKQINKKQKTIPITLCDGEFNTLTPLCLHH